MLDGIKSVLIALTKEFGPERPSSALAYGLSLAQATGAHATVQAASVRLALPNAFVSRYVGAAVEAENRRLDRLAHHVAEEAQKSAAMAGVICSAEAPHLDFHELLDALTTQARLQDLTILDAEPEALGMDRELMHRLLTESGRPVLVAPEKQTTFSAQRIMVAWDGSARAARAANDALPLLRAAEDVEVVAVVGEKELRGSADGSELAPHLARHGVNVSVYAIAAVDGDAADALRQKAIWGRNDLIVMGGYVHSRLRELVFGGVTQSLLKSSPVPLFMSY
ncbi:universal stress protein A [Alsobacter metallidurans]|uniref:Universal stress protein A n=1 Tax=Alsobacter metallidurans TaxID=340221 RepID=A0A917ID75_9HYPH|nr:universal stress protein [Alsobacter metallidurans]GGH33172.1 universal stress protein A [Alsobacter metallidurans]